MEKIVKFYNVHAEPCLALPGTESNSEKIKIIFETIFDKPVSDDFSYIFTKDGIKFHFDIKEKNNRYIFGTFCKEENFENDLLLQKRNTQNNSTGPYTQNPDEVVERFTYFLIEYNTGSMVAIHNQKLPRINRLLPEFIWNTTNYEMKLSIYPYMIEDLENHLKKFNKCKDLVLTFHKSSASNDYAPLPQVLDGTCDYDTYKIQFGIKSNTRGFFNKLSSLKNDSNCKGISITALNEYGLEDTINLMETVLTKKVGIELNTDMVFNTERIKTTLLRELSLVFTHNR